MTKPAKPGRPPRSKKASDIRFEIRLTGKERDRWQAAADRQGLTLAELVRESVETCIARGSSR
jgi:predicted HicB family RNase H-like nuclease